MAPPAPLNPPPNRHLHELTLLAEEGAIQLPPRVAAALGLEAGARVPARAAVLFVVNRRV
jgi:hypothetical protein